ncbi:hypothetical protein FACS1894152_6240 [Bacilli bacterium]|nr:hypothetical protein FACS1894152_6240 [Bacilli bacterium]
MEDEFNEYIKTNDIEPLMAVIECAMKAFNCKRLVDKAKLNGETIHYDLTKIETEPKIITFKSIFNKLGFDFSVTLNNSCVKHA